MATLKVATYLVLGAPPLKLSPRNGHFGVPWWKGHFEGGEGRSSCHTQRQKMSSIFVSTTAEKNLTKRSMIILVEIIEVAACLYLKKNETSHQQKWRSDEHTSCALLEHRISRQTATRLKTFRSVVGKWRSQCAPVAPARGRRARIVFANVANPVSAAYMGKRT